MHLNVIDFYDEVTEDSATVRMENIRKSTKRTLVDYVRVIRHNVMVTETEDISRGQWSQRT
jgi:hypothetical protein